MTRYRTEDTEFGPLRFPAATAKDRALFARVFIAQLPLRLFALITPLVFLVITTRCLCVAVWAHRMRLAWRTRLSWR